MVCIRVHLVVTHKYQKYYFKPGFLYTLLIKKKSVRNKMLTLNDDKKAKLLELIC